MSIEPTSRIHRIPLRHRVARGLRRFAQAAYERGMYRTAEWLLSTLGLLRAPSWWDSDLRGLIAERREERSTAISWYEEAARRGRAGHPLMRLAFLYAREDRFDDALAAARLLDSEAVEFGFAYDFGTLLAHEGRHQDALQWFELAARDSDPAARMCVGHSLLNLGRAKEAAEVYERLDNDGVHPSVRLRSALGVAKAEFDLGRLEAALATAREAAARLQALVEQEDRDEATEVIEWLEGESDSVS